MRAIRLAVTSAAEVAFMVVGPGVLEVFPPDFESGVLEPGLGQSLRHYGLRPEAGVNTKSDYEKEFADFPSEASARKMLQRRPAVRPKSRVPATSNRLRSSKSE